MGKGSGDVPPRHPAARLAGGLATAEEGAAILEFALVLPILFALLGGAFEIGRALLIRAMMIEAVRTGAATLARVPDPTCDMTCTPGAARAIGLTLDQILVQSGLPRSAVTVSSRVDERSEVVTMEAVLTLDTDLLRLFGLGPVITLRAVQQERRNVG